VIVGADGYPYGRVRPGVGALSTCTDGAGPRLAARVRVVSFGSASGNCDVPETRRRALAAAQCRMRTDVVRRPEGAGMASLLQQALRRKPVSELTAQTGTDTGGGELERSIGLFQLSTIGIGATIGTGIFFVLSQAVPIAGPAVVWSFVVAGVVAGLTAVCYAELTSAVPVSGSSYSYAYATLGEIVAMGVAACLLLEYGVSAAAVAVGWSEYLNQLLGNVFGVQIPEALSNSPESGGILNLPAVVLVALCALLLIRGTSESAKVNATMVVIKLAVLVLFIVIGVTGWDAANFTPFAPSGFSGVMTAAGVIFFSFIGLDAVSTAGEEVKNPRRNMPLAIMIALVVVTGLYIAVSLVALGAQPASGFEEQEAGLAAILQNITGSTWPGTVVAAGAVISIFSITLVVLYGQTRILFAMGRDGMLPPFFHRVNPRTLTPVNNTIVVAVVVGLLAGLLPINFLAEMTSIGTLVAFLVVSIGVMVLRRTAPDLPRGFKVPGYPVTPILSIIGCLWIIKDLRPVTILAFLVWVVIALAFYFAYGIRHSTLGIRARETDARDLP
jgi:APA family basic amino acid/polyamine antiporter